MKRIRRQNIGYLYSQFNEVSNYPRSSDIGERVNVFLTELVRISELQNLTSRAKYIFIGKEATRTILSRARFYEILDDLVNKRILTQVKVKNGYKSIVYAFKPVFLTPIKLQVPIRNLKVRNSVRSYLRDTPSNLDEIVKKCLTPGIVSSSIEITESEFFSNLDAKFKRYQAGKRSKKEKPGSQEDFKRDLRTIWASLVKYQQTKPSRRADYLLQDHFSGRVYNIATGSPKWIREYMRIGGDRLVEIDMRSAHAVLLWKVVPQTDFVRFLYDTTSRGLDIYTRYGQMIGINERQEVKNRFLRGLYGDMNSRYYKEFKRLFPEAGEILDGIKTRFIAANPSRYKGNYTNLAYILLNLEVRIFRKVWEGLYIHRIPFITIHDGTLVPFQYKDQARSLISEILRKEIPISEVETVIY